MFCLIIFFSSCARQKVFTPPPSAGKVPVIRVALDDNLSSGTLLFLETFQLQSEEATYILDASLGLFSVSFTNQKLELKSPERWFSFDRFERLELIPAGDGLFEWNGTVYQGSLTFVREASEVQMINKLALPEYLSGVIPYEIPSHSREYYQAILAQTVAARTYALYRISQPISSNFDIYSDSRDQVYQGGRITAPLVTEALQETQGVLLRNSSGNFVKIQYHSTCGGFLDFRSRGIENSSGQAIKDFSKNSYNCMVSPKYRWVTEVTTGNLLTNLSASGLVAPEKMRALQQTGFSMDIQVLSRKPSGRIDKITIVIDKNHPILLNEWQIRKIFSENILNPLPSTLFLLKKSPSKAGLLYLIGAGFGHGRGMCQWGAIGQALDGKSYLDILKFYYPELTLNKIY